MIEILRAGLQSSIQDAGRHGYRSIGVGTSGAMDDLALAAVNLLLANPRDAAVLEIALGRSALRFVSDTEFAIGGSAADARLDGQRLPNWWATRARAGQVLEFGRPQHGLRSYVALPGGIAAPVVLGARATDLKGRFGAQDGRALADGDRIGMLGTPTGRLARSYGLSPRRFPLLAPPTDEVTPIAMLPSAQWPLFSAADQARFLATEWRISAQSNRIGTRLEGEPVHPGRRIEMHSHGIVPGVVQVPPSGEPIVQLCDGNTAGGYPVAGVVVRAHLHLFAQFEPGRRIRFEQVNAAQAAALWQARLALLDDIEYTIQGSLNLNPTIRDASA